QVGKEQTVQTAYKSAEICALNTLANIKAAVGSLEKVARIVFVSGFVNATDGFTESPAVINGASDLFVKVFGDAGKHARAAGAVRRVGTPALQKREPRERTSSVTPG